MSDIFISYARSDFERARALAKAFEQQGYTVWWDPKILPGKTFAKVIEEALNKAKCVVVLWSKESVRSDWVIDEASEGRRRKILVPTLIEKVTIPLGFRQIHAVDLRGWEQEEHHSEFASMLEAIAEIVGRSQISVAAKAVGDKDIEKDFTNSLGMKFVLISAGSFVMGGEISSEEVAKKSGAEPQWYEDEHPQHKVRITKLFYLQTTQVTQGQWKKIMGNNPSYFLECGDDCPVEQVSWNDAQEFIIKLNQSQNTDKYRLPTEAEWEYACRAGSTSSFCFGDDVDQLEEYAWYYDNSEHKTHPVGQNKPNAWGLYDMHGNVWEWCQDWYGNYSTGHVTDPNGPLSGDYRVLRGGSWGSYAKLIRSANRDWSLPFNRVNLIGFRVARDL